MLRKLIRYDFKELGLYYGPIMILYAVIAGIFAVWMRVAGTISVTGADLVVGTLTGTILIVFCIATFAVIFLGSLVTVYYFYRKFVTQEAYLTMTMPVKTWEHIVSKMAAGGLWKIIFTLILSGILALVFWGSGLFDFAGTNINVRFILTSIWRELSHILNINQSMLLFAAVEVLISFFTAPLLYFACISAGQMFERRKLLMAVVIFIGFSSVQSAMSGMGVPFLYSMSFLPVMVLGLLQEIFWAIVYFAVTYWALDKRLNLE